MRASYGRMICTYSDSRDGDGELLGFKRTFQILRCSNRRANHRCGPSTFANFIADSDNRWYECIGKDSVRLFVPFLHDVDVTTSGDELSLMVDALVGSVSAYVATASFNKPAKGVRWDGCFNRGCATALDVSKAWTRVSCTHQLLSPPGSRCCTTLVFPDVRFATMSLDMRCFVIGLVNYMRCASATIGDVRCAKTLMAVAAAVDIGAYTSCYRHPCVGNSELGSDKRCRVTFDHVLSDAGKVGGADSDDVRASPVSGVRPMLDASDALLQLPIFTTLGTKGNIAQHGRARREPLTVAVLRRRLHLGEAGTVYANFDECDLALRLDRFAGVRLVPHYRGRGDVALVPIGSTVSLRVGPTLYLKTDSDVLRLLDPLALLMMGRSEAYLPVVGALCTSRTLSTEAIGEWAGDEGMDGHVVCKGWRRGMKCYARDATVMENVWQLFGESMTGVNIVDARDDPDLRVAVYNEQAENVYPKSPEWEEVAYGVDLRKRLQAVVSKDNRFVGTCNEKRRLINLTGKMGVGKTDATLQFAVDQLRRGYFKNAAYIGPRVLLVDNVADRIESMRMSTKIKNGKKMTHPILTKRYYGKSPDKMDWYANKTHVGASNGEFYVACINSIECIQNKVDLLIVDEMAMNVGNVFSQWMEQTSGCESDPYGGRHTAAMAKAYHRRPLNMYAKRPSMTKPVKLTIETDIRLCTSLADTMRRARVTIVMEASMSAELLAAYSSMWKWPAEKLKKDGDKKAFDKRQRRLTYSHKGVVTSVSAPKQLTKPRAAGAKDGASKQPSEPCASQDSYMAIASPLEALSSDDSDSDDDATIVSPVDVLPTDDLIDDESIGAVVDDGGARLQAQPLYFVVVPGENPAYPPIFDRIEEYETYAEMWKLIADDSAVGKRSVIYASTVRTLYDIKEMLVAYAVENGTLDSIADVSLIASQTGAEEVTCALEYWRGGLSPVAGCTIRLGAGVNLDTPNMFYTAYLFLHMSKGTADLTDMVQLSARVRSIVSRTLRYAVTSSNFGTNLHGDVTKRGQLKEAVSRVDPCLSRLYKYHDRRFLTKRFCASSLMYAKITARTMLVAAYSTRLTYRTSVRRPTRW